MTCFEKGRNMFRIFEIKYIQYNWKCLNDLQRDATAEKSEKKKQKDFQQSSISLRPPERSRAIKINSTRRIATFAIPSVVIHHALS